MNIQTERCIIRDFHPEDIDSLMEYRNDMHWMRYQGFKGMSKEAYEGVLLQNTPLAQGRQFAIISRTTGGLLGDIYLRQEDAAYWIGFTVHPSYARNGYTREAVVATIKWIANQGGIVVMAGVEPENTASTRLLETLGFTCWEKEGEQLIYTYHPKRE